MKLQGARGQRQRGPGLDFLPESEMPGEEKEAGMILTEPRGMEKALCSHLVLCFPQTARDL